MFPFEFTKSVGTAPGTTMVRPTQAVWEPDPNTDTIKIAMPANQWVTGPTELRVQIPSNQGTMGPVPNDLQHSLNRNYLPVERGWINNSKGEPVFNLQGRGLGLSTNEKWAIAVGATVIVTSVIGTWITVARWQREKRGKRKK